ncbi:DDE_3 domain-containing protein [Trichonephila clavipes]|nr:DDE_3 domain-containing protein [Trichonephila clavipes]
MRGTLTGQRYVDDILRSHTLPWPTRSPDLSPVEHVWDQLKRQMPSCHSVHDLELAVQDFYILNRERLVGYALAFPTGLAPPHFLNPSPQGSQLASMITVPSIQSESSH